MTEQEKQRGWEIWKDNTGLVLAKKEGCNNAMWIVPQGVRKEMIKLAHQDGHFGIEKALERLEAEG